MPREIAATTLAHLLETGSTLALIDVREHGEYNLAHIAGSSSVPRRQLESRIGRLVPYRGVPVVVCDDNGRRAALAAATLERMGYRQVSVLKGGVNRWASEDLPTEWGMRQVVASQSEPTYRLRAIRYLSMQGDQQSLATLRVLMNSPNEQPSIRDAAAHAYRTIGGK